MTVLKTVKVVLNEEYEKEVSLLIEIETLFITSIESLRHFHRPNPVCSPEVTIGIANTYYPTRQLGTVKHHIPDCLVLSNITYQIAWYCQTSHTVKLTVRPDSLVLSNTTNQIACVKHHKPDCLVLLNTTDQTAWYCQTPHTRLLGTVKLTVRPGSLVLWSFSYQIVTQHILNA
ncbi:hypothetical protein CEXT_117751 [Caerostris extrusa]|uniref:Uncharacterized protein n=1 Tax=Caerostris extrusa TaxID=172846 RepID=A0AAV4QYA0_CAEEX|nr:hypothetical protein CEXT_117751 [Caerostris extrusa]